MATYAELSSIQEEAGYGDFFDKCKVAIAIKAGAIIDQTTPTAEALEWARTTIGNLSVSAPGIVNYVISANNTATIAQILAATDGQIQSNVNNAVDAIYGAGS